METPSNQYIATVIKRRLIPHGNGKLVVHDRYRGDELIDSCFTFDSLTHVLDMPKSTLEGRYARGRLQKWKVDMPNGFGRPSRGFPLTLLDDVIYIICHKGAKVTTNAEEDVVDVTPKARPKADLELVAYMGKRYFTVPALADHFGVSETTIRKKLTKANLMRRMQDLGPSLHGGRPKRGMPESALGDVYLAIDSGAVFGTAVDDIRNRPVVRAAALSVMRDAIVPHELPPKNSLRAYDPETRAPVVPIRPLNGVNTPPVSQQIDTAQMARDTVAELEAIMGGTLKTGNPVLDAPAQHTTTPPAESDLALPQDDEVERMANLRAMTRMQFDALVGQQEEPTQTELRETAEMLDLSKPDADRFVAEVKAARAQRT